MMRKGWWLAAVAGLAVVVVPAVAWAAPGELDTTFGDGGVALTDPDGSGSGGGAADVVIDPAGRILSAGAAIDPSPASTSTKVVVTRHLADGRIDGTFGAGGIATVTVPDLALVRFVALHGDGGIVVAGMRIPLAEPTFRAFVVRFRPDGTADAGFGAGGVVQFDDDRLWFVGGVATDSSGGTIVGGYGLSAGPTPSAQATLIRLLTDGRTDSSFPASQPVTGPGEVRIILGGVAVDSAGRILAAGATQDGLAVFRYTPNGAADLSYGGGDGVAVVSAGAVPVVATAMSLHDDGAVTVLGSDQGPEVFAARFTPGGEPDERFGVGGRCVLPDALASIGQGVDVVVDVTGAVTLVRFATTSLMGFPPAEVVSTITRLLPDCRLDHGFGQAGNVDGTRLRGLPQTQLSSLLRQGERVVVAGADAGEGAGPRFLLGRIDGGTAGVAPPAASVIRNAGRDRFATAILISLSGFVDDGAPPAGDRIPAGAVVLASAESFPDALVGVPVAARRRGPLLLTGRDRLDPRVAAEIDRVLGAGEDVVVLGGTASVSDAVVNDLQGRGFHVNRIAGTDRFETSVKVAEQATDRRIAVLATGRDFPDALAGGAAAARAAGSVLLTDGLTMPPSVKAFLDNHPELKRFAVGAQAATADPQASPIVGVNRYATAAMVAERFFVTPAIAGIASGEQFPDALSGGSLAAVFRGPLLLSPPHALPDETAAFIRTRRRFLDRVQLFGGTAALNDAVQQDTHRAVAG